MRTMPDSFVEFLVGAIEKSMDSDDNTGRFKNDDGELILIVEGANINVDRLAELIDDHINSTART